MKYKGQTADNLRMKEWSNICQGQVLRNEMSKSCKVIWVKTTDVIQNCEPSEKKSH